MTMARRVDVGRQVRLRRSKPTMLNTEDGRKVEVEGNCDGVVIRGIDSKLWLIRWLNGTPNGLEAMATSRMISLVLPDDPPSTSGSSKSKPKSTPPSRGATNQANSKKKSKKKKKESDILFPTAEAWLNAYASDLLTIHPQGYIEDPSEDEENEKVVNVNASSSALGSGEDSNNNDQNGNNNDGSDDDDNNNNNDDNDGDDDNGDDNGNENGENMDAEELEEDNHPNLDLPPLDEPVDESCSKYRLKKAKYEKEKAELLESGYQVSCKDGRVWKAVENSISEKESEDPEHLGV